MNQFSKIGFIVSGLSFLCQLAVITQPRLFYPHSESEDCYQPREIFRVETLRDS